ncbi:MAG: nucleotidyltransferase domain-containing protein [Nanoarchaeota archaeon]|nr:nucleotidyltransferase domain-containing protein [Nanoarchaeota archaeon]
MKDIIFSKSFLRKLESLSKKYNISLFILFGSRAKGKAKVDSDYDMAYFPSKNILAKDDNYIFEKLMEWLSNEKIDLINIRNSKDYRVINNIFSEGIVLYEKNEGLFDEMKWRAWVTFQDFKPYYDKQFELSKKSILEMMKNG